MVEKVIQPLQRKDGIEVFRDIVVKIESRLRNGLLRNPWEVKVALLVSGRVSAKACSHASINGNQVYSRSPHMYQRFQEAVFVFCDDAMGHDSSWRQRCYAHTMERCLAISLEMDKRQAPGSSFLTYRPNVKVLEVVGPNQEISVSKTSVPSNREESCAVVSPISIASVDSLQSPQTSSRHSTYTSPTTVRTDSTSLISSPSSSILHSNNTRCETCDRSFKGSSGATNLQRHLKFDKPHNEIPSFECFEAGCNKKFGRSDNRNQHFRLAHPSSTAMPSRMRGDTKRRREVEVEGGHDAMMVDEGYI